MKRFLTLMAASLLTIAAMAAERRPSVTIRSVNNYEIVVDGRRYANDNSFSLSDLRKGKHTIKVYEVSRGLFNVRRKLVSSSSFRLQNNDLYITIDRWGSVRVNEARFDNDRRYDRDDNGRRDRDDDYRRGNDNRDWKGNNGRGW
jgi:hypothetical protein